MHERVSAAAGIECTCGCRYIFQRIDWQSVQVQQRLADWQLVLRELIDCSEQLGQCTLAMIGDPDVQLVADGVLEAMAEVGLSANSIAQAANPDRRSVRSVVDCTGTTVIEGNIDQADDENVLVVASWLAVKEMSMLLAQMVALVPLVVRPVSVVLSLQLIGALDGAGGAATRWNLGSRSSVESFRHLHSLVAFDQTQWRSREGAASLLSPL